MKHETEEFLEALSVIILAVIFILVIGNLALQYADEIRLQQSTVPIHEPKPK